MATILDVPSQKKNRLPEVSVHHQLWPGVHNVYVVIPVHNRLEYTRSCLRSLSQQTVENFKVIVIDDGSTDGTSQMIETEFPEVVLLRADGNLWWTRSVNTGVKYALKHGADYVMTLNDDIIVQGRFMETMLIRAVEHPNAVFGGVPINSSTKERTHGGGLIDWRFVRYNTLREKLKPENRHGLHEVDHLPGRALLIPAGIFAQVGLFDEINFPQGTADFDFTYRAHKAGYKLYSDYDSRFETYPDSIGGWELRRHRSLRNYYQHLFGIKGKGNLKYFIQFGWKHCPKPYLPSFILIGALRRIFGYLFEWMVESLKVKDRINRS